MDQRCSCCGETKSEDGFYRVYGKLIKICKSCRCVGGKAQRLAKRNQRQKKCEEIEDRIRQTTISERAYLAGIIDGEGSICPIRYSQKVNGKTYRYGDIRIAVYNTNADLIKWVSRRFGEGNTQKSNRAEGHKPCYQWSVLGRKTHVIIEAIIPYLVIKREQAKLALDYNQVRGTLGVRLTNEIKMERERIMDQLARLNKRGVAK